MSIKENGYVRSRNGKRYVELSQIFNVYIYGCWAKQCKKLGALCISFLLFVSKRYGATPVIRQYSSEQLGNLDRKEGNVARKYSEIKAFKKG